MPNPATITDLEQRWRPLSAAEVVVAQALLDDAWAIVKREVPDVEDRLLEGTLDEQLVIRVVCSMVLRVMRNPEGKRQEAIDDYSYTRDESTATGDLYLSDADRALLAPPTARRVRSVRLVAYGDG